MTLSDFLGQAGEIYSTYEGGQATQDAARTAQANAAAEAAKTQSQFVMTERTKTILIYSVGGILAIILVLFLIKKFK